MLLFYPGDNTPVCTRQFCSYRDRSDDMSALDATVIGISHQDVASHEEFTARHGLTVPLLADVDKAVAKRYGVAAPVLGTRRAAFVIDEDGVVRHRHVHALGVDFQDTDDLAVGARRAPTGGRRTGVSAAPLQLETLVEGGQRPEQIGARLADWIGRRAAHARHRALQLPRARSGRRPHLRRAARRVGARRRGARADPPPRPGPDAAARHRGAAHAGGRAAPARA